MVFHIDQPHLPLILYKKFWQLEQKMVLLKCKNNRKIIEIRDYFRLKFSYGGAFVECSLPHPTEVEIVQLVFRVNEVR
jgi:hypothetical protein